MNKLRKQPKKSKTRGKKATKLKSQNNGIELKYSKTNIL